MAGATADSDFPSDVVDDFLILLTEMDVYHAGQPSESPAKPTFTPLSCLKTSHIQTTLDSLKTSALVSEKLKESISTISADDLLNPLSWLNDCLGQKRVMSAAVVEKSWRAYHQRLIPHLHLITSITHSHPASSLITLQTMKQLVTENYKQKPSPTVSSNPINFRDIEILTYVSGYLLKKHRSSPEVQCLCATQCSGFMAAIDRGGLVKPKSEFVAVVTEMEEAFRCLPTKSVGRTEFVTKLTEQGLPSKFFDLLNDVPSSVEEKENLFMKISNLFFKVRAYHKCRLFFERHLVSISSLKKTKPLRDSF